MLTDVQTPLLGTPLVTLKVFVREARVLVSSDALASASGVSLLPLEVRCYVRVRLTMSRVLIIFILVIVIVIVKIIVIVIVIVIVVSSNNDNNNNINNNIVLHVCDAMSHLTADDMFRTRLARNA